MGLEAAQCAFEGAQYLVLSPNVPGFVYYSHIPVFVGTLFMAIFILLRGQGTLLSKILFWTIIPFLAWVFLDSIFWASNRSDVIMFVWSAIILIEPLIHAGIFYLLYTVIFNKFMPLKYTLVFCVLFLPLIVLLPTPFTLGAFDITSCLAIEGILGLYYSYVIEGMFIVLIFGTGIYGYMHAQSREKKSEYAYFTAGVLLFLLAFTGGNLIGSTTTNWKVGQFGLLGMPIFLGFLAYIIVRFKAFNIRLLGAQAIVVILWFLLLSTLFVDEINDIRIVIFGTLALVGILGWILIRAVKHGEEQRELLQLKDEALTKINAQQESLLHFITHEVKGYLTKSKAMFAAIVENDFPGTPENLKVMAGQALADTQKGVETVRDILDSSNLKRGTTEYKKEPFNFKIAVQESITDFEKQAQSKGLSLSLTAEAGSYTITGDEAKIRRHVIRNLIDNAIKYTQTGSIEIIMSNTAKRVFFKVKDSGVGIREEDKVKLFTEGGKGKDSIRVNVDSTGYGLFIAKAVVEAHGGTIDATSLGKDMGSTFTVQLPV